MCPHGFGWKGVEPVRTFFGQEEGGQLFTILCGFVLWTGMEKIDIQYIDILYFLVIENTKDFTFWVVIEYALFFPFFSPKLIFFSFHLAI